MKYFSVIIIILLICAACNQSHGDAGALQKRIDSLELKLADSYKPGFGEFMSNIQMHHAKLWFAGQNGNWALADFEVHEIMESLDDITQYQSERKESQKVGLLTPALDSINAAIKQQDPVLFKNSFVLLTNSCNNCHHATDFSFNVVKIPESPPVTNQSFKAPATE
ncbi:MAG: hypothetical protein JNN00_14275 [Chitinophagaceae bacterium]|nr:hypothetical protein [Chitinophagaceae bacterium]